MGLPVSGGAGLVKYPPGQRPTKNQMPAPIFDRRFLIAYDVLVLLVVVGIQLWVKHSS